MTQTTVTITPNDGPAFSMKVMAKELKDMEKSADIMKTQGKIKDYKFSANQ